VGPRAGLDVCEKSRPHRDYFYASFFVRILCFIVLVLDFSMFFLYRTSVFLDCKGSFPPSLLEDAAYWPDTQRTPLAKEGTNEIWPAISQSRSPDRPARSQSLYRLSYRAPTLYRIKINPDRVRKKGG
jgi:hypothetical protein